MKTLNHISTFTGIGGFDLAADRVGIKNIAQVENDMFCLKVLEKNFPKVKRFKDIKDFKGNKYFNKIDILSGGFPCQDISRAGVSNGRKALKGKRSGLFWELLRVVKEVYPKYFLYENSPDIISNGLTEIHKSLENINYVQKGYLLSARMFGFPHKRKRYFGVSFSNADGIGREKARIFNSVFEQKFNSKKFYQKSKNKESEFSQILGLLFSGKAHGKLLRIDDGFSKGLVQSQVKSLGNAVVPDIPQLFFEVIIETEKIFLNKS